MLRKCKNVINLEVAQSHVLTSYKQLLLNMHHAVEHLYDSGIDRVTASIKTHQHVVEVWKML